MDLALVSGVLDVDRMLSGMTGAQQMEWKAYVAIRGPIGPQRWDFYVSMLAMYAGSPYKKKVKFSEFKMPWAVSEPETDYVDPDDEYAEYAHMDGHWGESG
jgi:hypothetical protein